MVGVYSTCVFKYIFLVLMMYLYLLWPLANVVAHVLASPQVTMLRTCLNITMAVECDLNPPALTDLCT